MPFARVAVPMLVEEHASEAAFLWATRDHAVRSPSYDLDDLWDLDMRLAAHLDGLRIAGDTAAAVALDLLDAEMDPGEAFVAAFVALDRGQPKELAKVLDFVDSEPQLWRALPSAIGFCELANVERTLRALVARDGPPALQRMGISGYAAHRQNPGPVLGWGLAATDRDLRVCALEAVGELGDRARVAELAPSMKAEDVEERFWACRSAALCGDATGRAGLKDFAESEKGPLAEQAARLWAALSEFGEVRAWADELDGKDKRAIALFAAEASGDAGLLGWVVGCMHDEVHTRIAGHAFTAITGERIEDDLEAEPPEDFTDEPSDDEVAGDEDTDLDPDHELPWPAVAAAEKVLASGGLPTDKRLLLGQPASPEWLREVLRHGRQPEREQASWLLAARSSTAPFETRAPAWRQRSELS